MHQWHANYSKCTQELERVKEYAYKSIKWIGKIRDQHLDLRVQETRRKQVAERTRHLCEDISKRFPSICRGFRELGLVMPACDTQSVTTRPVTTQRSAEASIPCETETEASAAAIEQRATCMRLKRELKAAVQPFHHQALESAQRKFCSKVTFAMEGVVQIRSFERLNNFGPAYCVLTAIKNCPLGVAGGDLLIYSNVKDCKAKQRPNAKAQVEAVRDWDGKGSFQTYKNGVVIEYASGEKMQMLVPSFEAKKKWLAVNEHLAVARVAMKKLRNKVITWQECTQLLEADFMATWPREEVTILDECLQQTDRREMSDEGKELFSDAIMIGTIPTTEPTKAHTTSDGGPSGVPWIRLQGDWELEAPNSAAKRSGSYSFDRGSNRLTVTQTRAGSNSSRTTKSTVVMAEARVTATDFDKHFTKARYPSLPALGIGVHNSDIQTDMQGKGTDSRKHVYVLPSQLNAAEYMSPASEDIVSEVEQYLKDDTGGPRGQLGGDPGVAQFIIDNAANQKRPGGIDNTRLMEKMPGILLTNGYLDLSESPKSAEAFGQQLQNMTVLGVQDVAVVGLEKHHRSFASNCGTVDLVYASAAPLSEKYGNPHAGPYMTMIANMTLYAQYVAAMRLAIKRGGCDLHLMPLGGGVFENDMEHIKQAIAAAFVTVKDELQESDVRVYVLAYAGSHTGEHGILVAPIQVGSNASAGGTATSEGGARTRARELAREAQQEEASVYLDQIGRRGASRPNTNNIRHAVREAGLAAAANKSRNCTPSFEDARTAETAAVWGYLLKKTSRKHACNTWQVRWFVVAGNYLMQFKDKDAAERGARPSKRFELRNLREVSCSKGIDGVSSIQIVWVQDLVTELRIVDSPDSAKAAAWLKAFSSCGRRPSHRTKFALTDSPLPR
jgi:hypothetical protein